MRVGESFMSPRARLALLFLLLREASSVASPSSRFGNHQGGRSIGSNRKIRHHVNPLTSAHQTALALPPSWYSSLFADEELPLHVDIGCARGLFCLDAASIAPHTNFLGLEIRQQLVEAAEADASLHAMGNVRFLACNANVNFQHLLELAQPHPPLASVTIQFPDPWFKAKHKKRRVVQPELVASIVAHLPPNGWLFTQTDVLDLAEDMRETIAGVEAAACLKGKLSCRCANATTCQVILSTLRRYKRSRLLGR